MSGKVNELCAILKCSPCHILDGLEWSLFHEEHVDQIRMENWITHTGWHILEGESILEAVGRLYGDRAYILTEELI